MRGCFGTFSFGLLYVRCHGLFYYPTSEGCAKGTANPAHRMYAECVRGCFQIATSPRELDCIYCLYVYVHTRTLQCLSCFQGVRVLRALRPVFDRA